MLRFYKNFVIQIWHVVDACVKAQARAGFNRSEAPG